MRGMPNTLILILNNNDFSGSDWPLVLNEKVRITLLLCTISRDFGLTILGIRYPEIVTAYTFIASPLHGEENSHINPESESGAFMKSRTFTICDDLLISDELPIC